MSIPQSGGGPIEHFGQLVEYMESGSKPASDWRIGTEHEKFGWLTDTRLPLPYAGDRSISALFAGLEARFGWTPVREGENVIGMTRNGANISLEPGGQFELSGAAVETIARHRCRDAQPSGRGGRDRRATGHPLHGDRGRARMDA